MSLLLQMWSVAFFWAMKSIFSASLMCSCDRSEAGLRIFEGGVNWGSDWFICIFILSRQNSRMLVSRRWRRRKCISVEVMFESRSYERSLVIFFSSHLFEVLFVGWVCVFRNIESLKEKKRYYSCLLGKEMRIFHIFLGLLLRINILIAAILKVYHLFHFFIIFCYVYLNCFIFH